MKNFKRLFNKWEDFKQHKEEYAFGDLEIDIDAFKKLIKGTYNLIKEMHGYIALGDYTNVTAKDMRNYIGLVSVMSRYSEHLTVDESENKIFTATQLLTDCLVDLAANYCCFATDDGVMEERPIETTVGFAVGKDEFVRYDMKKDDLSGFIELAQLVWN